MHTKKIIDGLWDCWCVLSLVGIWPRFIEPKLLSLTKIKISIPHLPVDLSGLRILQFSDLHWNSNFSLSYRKKLINRINAVRPDIIVLTGDIILRAQLEEPEELLAFLSSLKAGIGFFAVLGNHDYSNYVSANAKGDYDVEANASDANISKGFKRLFNNIPLSKRISEKARRTQTHVELFRLLQRSPFQLLHNSCMTISIKESKLNVCGLGEYTLGRCLPLHAFKRYDRKFPGIVLAHNPDSIPLLLNYPGDLILSGHTHGGQVNLPFMQNKFMPIENPRFIRGLKKIGDKHIYINRGIGGGMQFRWFSRPELTLFTLEGI